MRDANEDFFVWVIDFEKEKQILISIIDFSKQKVKVI